MCTNLEVGVLIQKSRNMYLEMFAYSWTGLETIKFHVSPICLQDTLGINPLNE